MEITTNPTPIIEGISPTKVSVAKADSESVQLNVTVSQQEVEKKVESPEQAGNLHEAVSQINDYVQNLQRNLQFTVDEESGRDVVTVIDSQSEEVIRQIPSEEVLELSRRLAAIKDDGVQLISTQV